MPTGTCQGPPFEKHCLAPRAAVVPASGRISRIRPGNTEETGEEGTEAGRATHSSLRCVGKGRLVGRWAGEVRGGAGPGLRPEGLLSYDEELRTEPQELHSIAQALPGSSLSSENSKAARASSTP